MSTVRCQLFTAAGVECSRPATHQHVTQAGTRVSVCSQHYKYLRRREKDGSDEEALARAGITNTATNPGATGQPIPPEGIAG